VCGAADEAPVSAATAATAATVVVVAAAAAKRRSILSLSDSNNVTSFLHAIKRRGCRASRAVSRSITSSCAFAIVRVHRCECDGVQLYARLTRESLRRREVRAGDRLCHRHTYDANKVDNEIRRRRVRGSSEGVELTRAA
jgi:hypothetical protein